MNVKYCRNTEARHQLWTREMGIIYDRERGFFDALQWNEEAKAMRDVKKKKKKRSGEDENALPAETQCCCPNDTQGKSITNKRKENRKKKEHHASPSC